MTRHRLRVAGFSIMGVYTLLVVWLLLGEALSDPGGPRGFLAVFVPTVVFAGLAAFDRSWPRLGRWILIALAATAVGYHLLVGTGLVDQTRELDADVGYVTMLLAFLPVPVFIMATLHALCRPVEAGLLMVGAGTTMAIGRPGVALVLAGPAIVAGAFFVLAEQRADARRRSGATRVVRARAQPR